MGADQDLAANSLADLLVEAMSIILSEDDPADVRKLETTLAEGLDAVRRICDQLTRNAKSDIGKVT